MNLCTYRMEQPVGRTLKLRLTAGETCRFRLFSTAADEAAWNLLVPDLLRHLVDAARETARL